MAPIASFGSSQPGLLVQFRPMGPWRSGPESGAVDRVDRVYHSDTLFSAVSSAMLSLGMLEEWLDATARANGVAQIRFSSCFPYQGQTLFVAPPRNLWPPPPSAKVRWKGARFVPFTLIERLVAEKPVEEDRWRVDGLSECLLPSGKNHLAPGPVRVALRYNAAVDRLGAAAEVHSTACLEFSPDSGLWAAVLFSGEEARSRWTGPLTSALRLLADSGFGGKRSRGWGRAESPRVTEGPLPDILLKIASPATDAPVETAYWLLSLFSPAEGDRIDWQRGNYSVVTRSGRTESAAGWGAAKKASRMVEEGSVLLATQPLGGAAQDVAPDGFPHPVFRAGFAVAIPIPWRAATRAITPRPVAGEAAPGPAVPVEPVQELPAAAAPESEVVSENLPEPGPEGSSFEPSPESAAAAEQVRETEAGATPEPETADQNPTESTPENPPLEASPEWVAGSESESESESVQTPMAAREPEPAAQKLPEPTPEASPLETTPEPADAEQIREPQAAAQEAETADQNPTEAGPENPPLEASPESGPDAAPAEPQPPPPAKPEEGEVK